MQQLSKIMIFIHSLLLETTVHMHIYIFIYTHNWALETTLKDCQNLEFALANNNNNNNDDDDFLGLLNV